jgi:dimethylglycine dehydrogenase
MGDGRRTEWDMWSCDPRRFTDYTDHDYCVAKGMEVYGHEYGMHFPHGIAGLPAGSALSALHDRLKAAGAQFGAYNGWERANWFAQPGDDTSEEATQTWDRAGPWEARIREECEAVRDTCGVIAISGFTRCGRRAGCAGACRWAHRLAPAAPGRIGLAYFPDTRAAS